MENIEIEATISVLEEGVFDSPFSLRRGFVLKIGSFGTFALGVNAELDFAKLVCWSHLGCRLN